jgi:chromosome segregation ATPase
MSTNTTTPTLTELSSVLVETEARLAQRQKEREAASADVTRLSEEIAVSLATTGTKAAPNVRKRDDARASIGDLDGAILKLEHDVQVQTAALDAERHRVHVAELRAQGAKLVSAASVLTKRFRELHAFMAESVSEISAHNAERAAIAGEVPDAFEPNAGYIDLDALAGSLYAKATYGTGPKDALDTYAGVRAVESMTIRVPLS